MSHDQFLTFCIAVLLIMAFGLLWVIYGTRMRRHFERLRRTGYEARGVVVSYAYRQDSDGDAVPYPLVRFRGPDGRLITAESDFGGSFVPARGDEVAVLFDPAEPEKVHLETPMSDKAPTMVRAIGWIIMGGSGIALLVAMLLYFVFWDAVWGH